MCSGGYGGRGIEYFGCDFAVGGGVRERVMRSMRLFVGEMMP